MLARGNAPSTPTEFESVTIDFWAQVMRAQNGNDSSDRRKLQSIETFMKNRAVDQVDLDMLMVWIRSQQVTKRNLEALNGLNQVIIYK